MLFEQEDLFLVTGASSGIGRAIALALNEAGATVLANGRNTEALADTARLARRPEAMRLLPYDLALHLKELPAWLASLAKEHGRLRGLACAAGITANAPMSFYNPDKAVKIFDICCHAPLILGGAFCGRKINRGPGSAALFIAAAAAIDPNPGQGMYAAAKAGLVAGAKCLAKEAAGQKVRVNCISPGLVEGPMMDATVRELGERFLEREKTLYPLGFGRPEDVAKAALFMLSSQSSWLTGQNMLLSGGR